MKNSKIPPTYQNVMPYLIIKKASAFIDFAKNVFSASEIYKVMSDPETVMHAQLMIGDSTIMCADASEKFPSQPAGLFLYVDNADDTYKNAIEAGATVVTALSDQPYGRSGSVADPFGNTWWITSVISNQ